MRNIDAIIEKIYKIVNTHYLGNGEYARYLWQDENKTRKLGVNEYGCADAMNILYTINRFPKGEERELCLSALQALQNKESGLFEEATHHFMHTTAHCIAAIELFDALPLYPQKATLKYFTKEGVKALLDSLRWQEDPWRDSHEGAGVYVIGVLTGNVDLEWQNYYFDILYNETDENYGMSRKGTVCTGENPAPLFHHLNSWFHYLFNMQYAKKPLKYPEKLVDTCIKMYKEGLLGTDTMSYNFAHGIGFAQIDWVYTLNRATRETPHRFAEAKELIKSFADDYIDFLESLDFETHDTLNDLHCLFGSVCCLAELQSAIPGYIQSSKPLRLVLDRRPFI